MDDVELPPFALSPAQQEVVGLIAAILAIGPMERMFSGPVDVSVRGVHRTLEAQVTWLPGGGTAEVEDPDGAIVRSLLQETYGRLLTDDDCATLRAQDGSWTARGAILRRWVRSVRTRTGESTWHGTLEFTDLIEGIEVSDGPAHVLIIGGVALDAYPEAFPTDLQHRGGARDGFVTRIFGRPAVVRAMKYEDAAGVRFTAVA